MMYMIKNWEEGRRRRGKLEGASWGVGVEKAV